MKKNESEMNVPENSKAKQKNDKHILGPGLDGMGTVTAKLAIDKKLRKQLLENYDLIELVNKGRYYAAKAYSKDSLWFYEMLIDKQSGNIQVVSKRRKDKQLY